MTSEEIKKVLELHKKWLNKEQSGERANLRGANLRGSDLRWAALSGADLRGADLRGVDFDFSCFPLWWGGSKFKCDIKLVYQLLAHICTLDFPDDEGAKDLIMPLAVKSHMAEVLGLKEDCR